MNIMRLLFSLCIIVLSACNLAYRRPGDASIIEQPSELSRSSAPEFLVALPTEAPMVATVPTCSPQVDWMMYTVVRGDTLSGIAVRSRSTVAELAEANCLDDPNLIIEGQRIYVSQQPVSPTPVHDHSLETDMAESEHSQ